MATTLSEQILHHLWWGRSAVLIQRQVHAPVRNMPEFSPDELDPKELESLIVFISNLDLSATPETEVVTHLEEVFLYQWMALVAIESENLEDAKHYLQQAIAHMDTTQLEGVQPVLADLIYQYDQYAVQSDDNSEVPPELSLTEFHLRLALNALLQDDVEQARHQMGHFIVLESTRADKEIGEDILQLLANDEIEPATTTLISLIESLYPNP